MKHTLILLCLLMIGLGHSRTLVATGVGSGNDLETAQDHATNNAVIQLYKLVLVDKDSTLIHLLRDSQCEFLEKSSNIEEIIEVKEVTKESNERWKIKVIVKWKINK